MAITTPPPQTVPRKLSGGETGSYLRALNKSLFLIWRRLASLAATSEARVDPLIQQVRASTTAYDSSAVTMPHDDTIPQVAEGAEFLSVTITPTAASSTLVVEANLHLSTTALGDLNAALFRDGGPDAFAAAVEPLTSGKMSAVRPSAWVVAGSTSATTFTARAGVNGAGTIEINGQNGSRIFGGVCTSWLTVTEYAA